MNSATWNNTHALNVIGNITTEQRPDGIYVQVFVVKDGVRCNMKVIELKEVSNLLVNSLMDGIGKLCV